MLPKLTDIISSNGLSIWVTDQGTIGTGFEIRICDLETENQEEYFGKWTKILRSLNPSILGKIEYRIIHSEKLGERLPRSHALDRLGSIKRKVFFYPQSKIALSPLDTIQRVFTKKDINLDNIDIRELLFVRDLFVHNGIEPNPLSHESIRELFEYGANDWVRGSNSVSNGKSFSGIIRLSKLPAGTVDPRTVDAVARLLPPPFDICVSMRAVEEARGKLWLEQRLRKVQGLKNVTDEALGKSTSRAIEKSLMSGTRLVDFEFLVRVSRDSEEALTKDLRYIQSKLSPLGDFSIETYGIVPSYIASLPTCEQHVTQREFDENLPVLLPIWTQGSVSEKGTNDPCRSLSLFRQDRTLEHFDLFNPSFEAFNFLILGPTGKGKSVLTGLLTRSLLNEPRNRILKVDVGGSHRKECELYNGVETIFSLGRPSGLNPFEVVKLQGLSVKDRTAILSQFLFVLIREEGEITLSKQLSSEIESRISEYIESNPGLPSIDDFFLKCQDFPRRDLLKRWTTKGLYGFAFQKSNSTELEPSRQLQYFNFSEVFQAANPEFSQAGMAAVLAQFSAEVLQEKEKRIVLECEEVPFFIKSCFGSLKLASANVRKLGHSIGFVAQSSTDLIVGNDPSLITNSAQRFLFGIDGSRSEFQERFQLSNVQMDSLASLTSIPAKYSEVLLQTRTNAKKLRIEVTSEEYWALTSSKTDQTKLSNLMTSVPGLSLEKAIQCLSVS